MPPDALMRTFTGRLLLINFTAMVDAPFAKKPVDVCTKSIAAAPYNLHWQASLSFTAFFHS